ncbi:membrane hypothetical protein [Xenorhabdus bovienii str. kraussei Becker Underwood]|uniref:Uncharacterized protein n=1 Tax=Xenorhabdus bovienii str. kraussei Becker Underwood TaxID=1398204 RepID=A0A077PXK6_XENBV|nr:DUF2165 family protein [Xenorhabdus bovienii]CDH25938.1 membrane hypothetical protein [Xenorhabdus bovienii str. kraussei Becker Underwood]
MDPVTGIALFKALHAFGIAGWATIGMINNVQSFTVTTSTVGRMMSMTLLKQEPPVNTPLLRRATTSRAIHSAALAVIVILQALTAIAMWSGGYLLLTTAASHPDTLLWLNVGIALLRAHSCCYWVDCGMATGYAKKACNLHTSLSSSGR